MATLAQRIRVLAAPKGKPLPHPSKNRWKPISPKRVGNVYKGKTFSNDSPLPADLPSGIVFKSCTFTGPLNPFSVALKAPQARFEECVFQDVHYGSDYRDLKESDWSQSTFIRCRFVGGEKEIKRDGISFYNSPKLGVWLHGSTFEDCAWSPDFPVPTDQSVFLKNCHVSPVPEEAPKNLSDKKHGKYHMAKDGKIVLNAHLEEKGNTLKFHDAGRLLRELLKVKRSKNGKMHTLSGLVFHRVDLAGESFHGLRFQHCRFYDCNLAGVQLFNVRSCEFVGCDLSKAFGSLSYLGPRATHGVRDAYGVQKEFCIMERCTFRGDHFRGLSASHSVWKDCTLVDVHFDGCALEEAVFDGGSFHNVKFDHSVVGGMRALNGALNGGPSHADLTDAKLVSYASGTVNGEFAERFQGLAKINAGKTNWGQPHRWVYDKNGRDGRIALE